MIIMTLLGLYAIAELWGYKQFSAELKQRIDKNYKYFLHNLIYILNSL